MPPFSFGATHMDNDREVYGQSPMMVPGAPVVDGAMPSPVPPAAAQPAPVAQPKPVDIADLDTAKASDEGAEFELRHPSSGSPLGIFIKVRGKDSEILREHMHDKVNRRARKEAQLERRKKTVDPRTSQEVERDNIETLVVCTMGWRNMFVGGQLVEFSPTAAMDIYSRYPWIREQVDENVGDLENFIKG